MFTTANRIVFLLLLVTTPLVNAAQTAASRPNIVVLLSDNLGYGDIGVYGGGAVRGAPTPRLDAFANQGLRLTNFNVEAECTPSRSAFMTGRYAVRSGTTRAMPVPGMPQGLAPWETSMAEMLKEEGYNTALFGKWHLGASEGRLPTDQGFDQWWGFPNSTGVANFSNSIGFEREQVPLFHLYEGSANAGSKPVEEYTLERRPFIDETIEQRSISYIEQQSQAQTPFFLFISWSLVHHPSIPHPDFAGKSGNGRYSDVMMEHDYRVGRILDAIDAAGIRDDTLVVYASDNGPDRAEYPYIGDTGPFRGYLGTVHEGSIRTPAMLRWPGKVAPGVSNEMVSIHDFYPSIATIADAKLPDDRAIDGVDQSPLFLGRSDRSARDSVLFFQDRTLSAVKWKQFKIYLREESPSGDDKRFHKLWAPLIYNTMIDPKESNDIAHDGNLWMMAPLLRQVMQFFYTLDKYGLIEPGADERSDGEVEVPFFSQTLMERSLSEIKQQKMKETLHQITGGIFEDDDA